MYLFLGRLGLRPGLGAELGLGPGVGAGVALFAVLQSLRTLVAPKCNERNGSLHGEVMKMLSKQVLQDHVRPEIYIPMMQELMII